MTTKTDNWTRRRPATAERSGEASRSGSHLLVLPAPMTYRQGRLCYESQACDGLRLWAEHFDTLIVAGPCFPDAIAAEHPYNVWQPVDSLGFKDRVRFMPLPWAYTVREFACHYRATRDQLRDAIAQSQYLQFAIGGAWGDWPSVAAEQALRMRRSYAIHVDIVAAELEWLAATSLRKRVKAIAHIPMIRLWERRLMRNAGLVLCNGGATHEFYRGLNDNSHVIYCADVFARNATTDAQVRRKRAEIVAGEPLRIVYAGRISAQKAPLQWMRAIELAIKRGARIKATWLGDGEMIEDLRREIAERQLGESIQLAGFVSDREAVYEALRDAHVLAFAHLIRESPRILIESLACATPIVGYDSAYARGLVRRNNGGRLVPLGDWQALSKVLLEIDRDREELSNLVGRAHLDGQGLTAEAMCAHRADLLKEHLP